MAVHPYLFFSGTCRSAMEQYHEIFGGDLQVMSYADAPEGEAPAGAADLVMHAALTFGDNLLMASDDPTGDGGRAKGISVVYSASGVDDAERVFAALAEGGEVGMPMGETFWSPRFGMCVDRFGIPWMVDAGLSSAG